MSQYIIVGDVDRIQDYVFGSSRLRAIRGASALLSQAAEHVKTIAGEDVKILRWRGGQIVAKLEVEDADPTEAEDVCKGVCAQFEEIFRKFSAGEATLTTGYAPYDGIQFGKSISDALLMVQMQKDGRQLYDPAGEALITSPYDRRCDLLPVHFATERRLVSSPGEPEEFRYHSPAADTRWYAVLKDMPFDKDLHDEFDKVDPPRGTGMQQFQFPYAPDDLFLEKDEGQYIALVMADGNGFGRLLDCINNENLYERYSKELYSLSLEAVAKAAWETGIDRNSVISKRNGNWLPLVPIILAGDDLSFMVRKEHAMIFAAELCKNFCMLSMDENKYPAVREVVRLFRESEDPAREMLFPGDDQTQWRLTLSVGIAIAKKNFPISALRRLAGELRGQAKRKLRREGVKVVKENGAIDFAVITTATVQPLEELRKNYRIDEKPYLPHTDPRKTWTGLTERPYTAEDFNKLKKLAAALKRIPRSKRKFLYTGLFTDKATGTEAYRFILARDPAVQEKVKEKLSQMNVPDAQTTPFRDNLLHPSTPLIDALELAELL
jgi:hypothetical protein